jgi:hypothetical protein
MGHISDLPADVLWLIFRRAMYVDYKYPYILDDVTRGGNGLEHTNNFSLVRGEKNTLICVIVRYARVNRRWLHIIASKIRLLPSPVTHWSPRWKFVNGAWADFQP